MWRAISRTWARRAILLGVVGEDDTAEDLQRQLAACPTIRAVLVADDTRPTSVKTRYVADGQQVMRADRESCSPLSRDAGRRLLEAFLPALEEADLVVMSD